MKLMKRSGIYKAANVTFNPKTCEAFSYSWWKFVGIVEGLVVFNNYSYSKTTGRHQAKVRRLLAELGVKIDLELPVPEGLPGSNVRGSVYGVLDTVKRSGSLSDLILEAEEFLCDQFLREQIKRQERYAKAKERREAQRRMEFERSEMIRDEERMRQLTVIEGGVRE